MNKTRIGTSLNKILGKVILRCYEAVQVSWSNYSLGQDAVGCIVCTVAVRPYHRSCVRCVCCALHANLFETEWRRLQQWDSV